MLSRTMSIKNSTVKSQKRLHTNKTNQFWIESLILMNHALKKNMVTKNHNLKMFDLLRYIHVGSQTVVQQKLRKKRTLIKEWIGEG